MNLKPTSNERVKIIKDFNLQEFIEIIADHWSKSPTTLGHGFHHITRVAYFSYHIGKNEKVKDLKDLVIISLFHDIYRPARGEAGKEDQTKGADIMKKLIKYKVSELQLEKILKAYKPHNQWAEDTKGLSTHEKVFFIADKVALNIQMADAYAWASNDYLNSLNKDLAFKVPLDTYKAFISYQKRHLKVISSFEITDKKYAIDETLNVTKDVIEKHQSSMSQIDYHKHLDTQAEKETKEEVEIMKDLGLSNQTISEVSKYYHKNK